MSGKFNSLEVLKMAMNVEKQGEKFYRKCAEVNNKKEVVDIFTQLYKDEQHHYNYFKKLLDQFDKTEESIDKDYVYDQQVNGYLKSLVSNKVFPTNKEDADKFARNFEEAIKIGIEAEKNSILLYQELQEVEEDDNTIKALKRLVKEEKEHLVKLQNIRD
ncbi:MAG: ferritin-like domain-containing protein, partial [Bacillota bacterium]